MRVIFAGTPDFAALALRALLDAGHDVPLVLTQPDRPAGRGMTLQASAVKQVAVAAGIEVFQPPTLRDAAAQERILSVGADVMVVAAYGLILPPAVLRIPAQGCINIHASLLPRWRGAAPIQRAILAGDSETGVCIMQMEAGLDTGPVLCSAVVPIDPADTAETLHNKLASLGARLVVEALARLPLPAIRQAEGGVSYAAKIDRAEAQLDWNQPAEQLARQVRAFNPFPGAASHLNGAIIKIWQAEALPGTGTPGLILVAEGDVLIVGCGQGLLRIIELQKAGGKRLSATQFLAGAPLLQGGRFLAAAH